MVQFYLRRIENDLMTLEEVPSLWYNKVKAELEKANATTE